MKTLTLKKSAAAIQVLNAEIANLRGEIQRGLACSVSIYGKLNETMKEANEKLVVNVEKFDNTVGVMYELRAKVSKANHENGVDVVLNGIASIDAKIASTTLLAKAPVVDADMAQKRMASAVNRLEKDTSGFVNEEISISVVDSEMVENANKKLKVLKRNKRELQDELLMKNVTHTIEISDIAEKILTDLAVI